MVSDPEQKLAFFNKHYDASLPEQVKICFIQIFEEQLQNCLNAISDLPEENARDLLVTLAKFSPTPACNEVDNEGNTLAHYACKYLVKTQDIVSFLTMENCNLKNKIGGTPGDLASRENVQKFMRRVIEDPAEYI